MSNFRKQETNDNTPNRAILEFIDKATPKESPTFEDTTPVNKIQEPLLSQDLTPKAGSQGIQWNATKRKLNEEPPQNETPTKTTAIEMSLVTTDSLMEISDVPSHMDSPIVKLPIRPNLENRKRVSLSEFKHVIEKTKTQNNLPTEEISITFDASIPSILNSPDTNLPLRLENKSKKRVSTAAFRHAIEQNKVLISKTTKKPLAPKGMDSPQSLSLSDSSIPSSFIIPDLPYQANFLSKTNTSSSAFKYAIEQGLIDNPIKYDSTEQTTDSVSSSNPSLSTSQEVNLSMQSKQLTNVCVSSLEPSPNLDVPQLIPNLSKSQACSASIEHIDEKSRIPETQFEEDKSNTPSNSIDSKSLERASPSSTPQQSIFSQSQACSSSIKPIDEESRVLEIQPLRDELAFPDLNLTVKHISELEFSRMMNSSIPSSLHSPSVVKILERPCPKSKKRVSTTAFKEALEKRKILDAQVKETTTNHLQIEAGKPTASLPDQLSEVLPDYPKIDNEYSYSELPESEINRRETALPEDFFPVASSTQVYDLKTLNVEEINPVPSSPPKMSSIVSQRVNLSPSDVPSGIQSAAQTPLRRSYSLGSSRKRVSMTEFLPGLSKSKISNKDLLGSSESSKEESNKYATFTVSSPRSSSPSQNISAVLNDRTTAVSSVRPDVEIVPTTDDEGSGSQPVQMNHRSPDHQKPDLLRMASVSTLSPPDFSKSGSSGDADTTASTSEKNRSRKSLKFDSPISNEISKLIESLEESDEGFSASAKVLSSSDEEINSDPGPIKDVPLISLRSAETPVLGHNPTAKNSTVIAGGMSFYGPPLLLSPIGIDTKGVPATVQATPLQPTRKYSISQSPMYMSVMQKRLAQKKTEDQLKQLASKSTNVDEIQQDPISVPVAKSSGERFPATEREDSITPLKLEWSGSEREDIEENFNDQSVRPSTSAKKKRTVSRSRNKSAKAAESSRVKKSSTFKGLSSSNPAKGKSLASAENEETPVAIRIAREAIVDRSRDYVPLEQRLRANPIFQEKVRCQREKIAAEKEMALAAAAGQKTSTKKRAVKQKGPEAEHVGTASVNKANIRFYSQPMNVGKEALDAIHTVVGNWFEFTLDQMETFCANKGKESLDTWEDCYAMLKSQGIVDNYWEYSGLCHELLAQDECASLLPSSFPPGHYESKRAAARK